MWVKIGTCSSQVTSTQVLRCASEASLMSFHKFFFCLAHLGKSAPTCVAYEYVYDFLDTQEQSEQRLFPKRQVFFNNTENAY